MKYDWLACESFDTSTLRPLDKGELGSVRKACEKFIKHFNMNGGVEGRRFDFRGTPANIDDLDYDFYEFGGNHWHADHGYGFTCTWSTVLVESFGFEWAAMNHAQSLKDCVLRHRRANCSFFPWQHLWSVVQNTAGQTTRAKSAWLRIVQDVDQSYVVPKGWYPAIDALEGRPTAVPENVVPVLRRFRESTRDFVRQLGFDVYYWDGETDWDAFAGRLHMVLGDELP